ncbi:tripartite tricarboxylate transporter substrate binding protein [Candidimonas sp. SYP-B2681]|uniref:Bug family tripartite tricarboxylate transporter substrate binding protein n=1 Tax=Candidimonas sp. SYP-B2681 TaxID=2497686 RepID=UPI000F863C9C|nr:tripartite tricarboxylate transporter substrate binding protein [Candidimonas sp. SYP-B2681]RTZ45467.1 tripartite tricarboxylate transporter substrate binding protein [Candidimonas sp. SYP-B2681]
MSNTRNLTKGMTRRTMLASMAGMAAMAAVPSVRAESTWKPKGPIRLIVAFTPGGGSDSLGRLVAAGMSERLGQPVVVENKPGGTGVIANRYVYSGPADGSLLLLGVADTVSLFPHIAKNSVDVTKFVPIYPVGTSVYALVGRPDLPAQDLKELMGLMKEQQLTCANPGVGASPHLMAIAFGNLAQGKGLLHVPFSGTSPVMMSVLGKQVDMAFVGVSGMAEYIGKVKFFGTTGEQRMESLPDVPTFVEQGVPLTGEVWRAVLAPPGLPENIANALYQVVHDVVSSDSYKAQLKSLGIDLPKPTTPPEFKKYYLDEYERWGTVIRGANLTAS